MTSTATATTLPGSATYAACVVWRCMQGLAAALPVALLANAATVDWPLPAVTMGMSALLLGLGIGVAADRWLRTRVSALTAIRGGTGPLVVGLWLLWLLPNVEMTVCWCLLIGLGVGGEWSTLADACRGELSARNRWNGIRLWTAAFAFGMAIACLLPATSTARLCVAAAGTLAAMGLLTRSFQFSKEPTTVTQADIDQAAAPLLAAAITDPPQADQSTELPEQDGIPATTEDGGCDATDCCGGSKPAVPTRFSQGVLLATVAWCLLLSILTLLFPARGNVALQAPLGLGLIAGSLLMFTTAPRTGYAVALMPFFLLLAVLLLAIFFAVSLQQQLWCVALLAMAASAAHCGLRLTLGESFSDCSSDPVRTRVLVVALFAAAAGVLLVAATQRLLPTGGPQVMPLLILIVVGIDTIRRLPAPVVSSLGEDDPDSPDPDELNDVMAIVNEQV